LNGILYAGGDAETGPYLDFGRMLFDMIIELNDAG